MRNDLTKEIRQHYISLLTGITVRGVGVPVINLAKTGQQLPYILVFGGSAEGSDTKGSYNDIISVNIQVHTDFKGNYGGEAFADEIVNEILNRRFETRGYYGETDNYKLVTCTYNASESARIDTNTSVHIYRLITFTHYVSHKN
jgi:hypothetical protein